MNIIQNNAGYKSNGYIYICIQKRIMDSKLNFLKFLKLYH